MKQVRRALLLVGSLYILYLIKSAMGIDISRRYHAADLFKLPLRAIEQVKG